MTRLLPPPGPARWLAAGTFAGSVGSGAVVPFTAVFFVHSVGLDGAAVGLGMALASVLGIVVSVPAGWLSDRVGARGTAIALSVLSGAAVASFLVVRSYPAFLLAECLVMVCFAARRVAENTLIGLMLDQDSRVGFKAYQRSVYNLGFSLGTLGAAVPLQLGTRSAYLGLLAAGALMTASVALTTARVPSVSVPAQRHGRDGPRVPRDGHYLAVALLSGLTAVRNSVLMIAVPLWVVGHTDAPPSTASALLVLNTVMVVLLQVRAARGVDEPGRAVGVNTRGSVALCAGCVLYGVAGPLSPGATVTLLLLATACFTWGEMWTSAAGWSFSYDLADPARLGAYQGIFGMGAGLAEVVGPVLATSVIVALGTPGWVLTGAGFVVVALATGPVVARCLARLAPEVPGERAVRPRTRDGK